MIGLVETSGGLSRYQLQITLRGSKPRIWRRVLVSISMPLDRLHKVIQTVMGWKDCHLHQFSVGSKSYGVPDSDSPADMLNERDYTLLNIAPESGRKFIYEYDFGDDWQHEVVVEKVVPVDPFFNYSHLFGRRKCVSTGRLRRHFWLLRFPCHSRRSQARRAPADETMDWRLLERSRFRSCGNK